MRRRPQPHYKDDKHSFSTISVLLLLHTILALHSYCCQGFVLVPSASMSTRSAAPSTTTITKSSTTCTLPTTTSLDVVDLQMAEFSSSHNSNNNNHDNPPVLLLHGLLGNKRNFSTIGSSLVTQLQKKRRVLALDLRNHGDNTHDWRDDMSYTSMSQDILQLMDKHNMEQAVLVGHSVGGKVAQTLALTQPERVHGLVVLDIAPVEYTNDEPHWKAVQDIVRVLEELIMSSQSQSLLSKRDMDVLLRPNIPDPALRAFLLTNVASDGTWKIPIRTIAHQLESLAGFDVDPEKSYEGDAFFIHGGQSRFVRHKHMDTIRNYFPNHMLTTVRGAGHWIHAEAPDDTIALLKKYLDR